MDTLRIVSTNYNGQTAVITYYPDTGGTINLGTQVLPYDYVASYFYGTYSLFFPTFGSTCTLYVEDLSGNFLLQENGDYIFQENYSKIIIESAPSPTPTNSLTPSRTPSITPTRTPSLTPTPSPIYNNYLFTSCCGFDQITVAVASGVNVPQDGGLIFEEICYYLDQVSFNSPDTYIVSQGQVVENICNQSGCLCPSVTPTPSITPSRTLTPTPTPTPTCPGIQANCYGYSLDNTGGSSQQCWEWYDCEGNYLTYCIPAFDSYYITCARAGSVNRISGPVGPLPGEDLNPCGTYCAPSSPSVTPTVTPTRTLTLTPTPSITPSRTLTPTPTPTSSRPAYTYYRWRITDSKINPPNANAVQSSEFVFQIGGVDQSMAGVTVTNPGGSNPVGEEPSKLVDGSLSVKALDLNFVSNGFTSFVFQFGSAKSFNGYRWATANDEEGRDPKSWTIDGSNNGTTWTTLHTVTGFSATATRNSWQTAQTY